jgi:hypothetical protein
MLRIFGPRRDEVARGWRKLYNEELHNLYSSPSKIIMVESRRMKWVGHVAGKPGGKRQLGRPRYRWVDNIET